MGFWNKLLSGKDEISSKRFISMICLVLFVVVVVCAIFQINVSDTIIMAIVSLILGGGVLSVIPNKNNMNKNDEEMPTNL